MIIPINIVFLIFSSCYKIEIIKSSMMPIKKMIPSTIIISFRIIVMRDRQIMRITMPTVSVPLNMRPRFSKNFSTSS